MARFGTTSPASFALASAPQAAKPWARLPQERRARRGAASRARAIRSRYRARLPRLRCLTRSVTSATRGWTVIFFSSRAAEGTRSIAPRVTHGHARPPRLADPRKHRAEPGDGHVESLAALDAGELDCTQIAAFLVLSNHARTARKAG